MVCDSTPVQTTALRTPLTFVGPTSRARAREGAALAARARGWCATAPRFNNCVEGAALAFMAQTSRARVREGRGADGGGAARARGSCATAPRFNNCVEG